MRATTLASLETDDNDNDGISGVPNWIELASFVTPNFDAITKNGKYIGRFGRKAGAYNLFNQTVNAYNQDMGIVSAYSPNDTYSREALDHKCRACLWSSQIIYCCSRFLVDFANHFQ